MGEVLLLIKNCKEYKLDIISRQLLRSVVFFTNFNFSYDFTFNRYDVIMVLLEIPYSREH